MAESDLGTRVLSIAVPVWTTVYEYRGHTLYRYMWMLSGVKDQKIPIIPHMAMSAFDAYSAPIRRSFGESDFA